MRVRGEWEAQVGGGVGGSEGGERKRGEVSERGRGRGGGG